MMHSRVARLLFATLTLSLTMSAGCGKTPVAGRPTLVPVSGTVLFNKEPSAQARIVFAPQDHQYAAAAVTDSEGRFRLQTFDADDGAVPGNYRVVVSKFEVIDHPDGSFEENFFLPNRYRDPETSGLVAVVPESGTDNIMIELVD